MAESNKKDIYISDNCLNSLIKFEKYKVFFEIFLDFFEYEKCFFIPKILFFD